MKYICTLIIACLSSSLIAQQSKIGFSFSPNYSFRTLVDQNSTISDLLLDTRSQYENTKLGYTVASHYSLKIRDRLSVQSGVQFSDRGYRSKIEITDNDDPLLEGISELNINDHFYFFDIPITIKAILAQKKPTSIYVTGSIVGSIFIQHRATDNIGGNGVLPSEWYKPIVLGAAIGFGLEHLINDKFCAFFEPSYFRNMTAINENTTSIKGFLYDFRGTIGVSYNLKSRKKNIEEN